MLTFSSFVALVILFNKMTAAVNRVEQQWADVDVALQRRSDLAAKLVDTVRGYLTHEVVVLVQASTARSTLAATTGIASKNRLLGELDESISKVLLLAEDYPELKALENFLALQKGLVLSERILLVARQKYNESVRAFNTLREALPTNIFARTKRFAAREYFQASPGSEYAPTA